MASVLPMTPEAAGMKASFNLMAPLARSGSALVMAAWLALGACAQTSDPQAAKFVDLSLMVSPELPGAWPAVGFAPFHLNHYLTIGGTSAYNCDILVLDGNTGTQLDVPPHSIPRPETNLPNAGPWGRMFTDRVPAWQFCGEACVVDCRDLRDSKTPGRSELVTKDRVIAWEKQHRPLGPGDVVLFRSDYTDTYYTPLPGGRRFVAEPVAGSSPAWPDPDPECMEYLASRQVMTLGTDSASMGPLPDLAEPTHLAGLKHGMIWTESATSLGKLPTTGAFYCMLAPKHADGPYSEGRAIAIVGDPLAKRLIDSARKKQVIDLSVVLSSELPITWPGRGVGNHRQPYLAVPLFLATNLGIFHTTHMLDATAGTHLVPPSYALPAKDVDNRGLPSDVQALVADYEAKYGPRGTSDVTAEQVPLEATCGRCRVIDVKHRIGTTSGDHWPASPEITVRDIEAYEKSAGGLAPGDIVIFSCGYSDTYLKPLPRGSAFMADPLNGKREGWPAPGPEAIVYLANKKVRCVGTDGPTLGGAEPKRALMTYWTLGSKDMVGVECLTNLAKVPKDAYFLFAPVKVRGCHGGPGRAIALY
jgi:kynurenine formamidase